MSGRWSRSSSSWLIQPWGVVGGGEELGTGEEQVAFAGAFLGKPEAVAEFELGLVVIAGEPVQIVGVARCCAGPRPQGRRCGRRGRGRSCSRAAQWCSDAGPTSVIGTSSHLGP